MDALPALPLSTVAPFAASPEGMTAGNAFVAMLGALMAPALLDDVVATTGAEDTAEAETSDALMPEQPVSLRPSTDLAVVMGANLPQTILPVAARLASLLVDEASTGSLPQEMSAPSDGEPTNGGRIPQAAATEPPLPGPATGVSVLASDGGAPKTPPPPGGQGFLSVTPQALLRHDAKAGEGTTEIPAMSVLSSAPESPELARKAPASASFETAPGAEPATPEPATIRTAVRDATETSGIATPAGSSVPLQATEAATATVEAAATVRSEPGASRSVRLAAAPQASANAGESKESTPTGMAPLREFAEPPQREGPIEDAVPSASLADRIGQTRQATSADPAPAPATKATPMIVEVPSVLPDHAAVPPAPVPMPAEPPPAPRAAPVAWPARQIAPFAVALALGPDATLNLTLDPVELGRVEIAIERNGAEAIISVNAERPETLALLQRDRAELERALANAGLGSEGRGATLSFGAGGESAERREQRGKPVQSSRHHVETNDTPREIRARGLLDLAV